LGFWESKDEYDILDKEIDRKLAKDYPDDNILFEDSQTAVLIQAGAKKSIVLMRNAEVLDRLINAFINYIRPEVKDFREAITTVKSDLPTILNSLRDLIAKESNNNHNFCQARDKFLTIFKIRLILKLIYIMQIKRMKMIIIKPTFGSSGM
jgi:hypothetical protein